MPGCTELTVTPYEPSGGLIAGHDGQELGPGVRLERLEPGLGVQGAQVGELRGIECHGAPASEKLDLARVVQRVGGDVDDAGAAEDERVVEQGGQAEPGQVVEGDVHLDTVDRQPAVRKVRAGVVDQDVHRRVPVGDVMGRREDVVAA